jgi:transcription initiation factor TFIIB
MTETDSEQASVCLACNGTSINESVESLHGFCENCGLVIREDADSISREWVITDDTFDRPEDKNWLSECRVRNGTEQQLAQAFNELEAIASQLSLSEEIREETVDLYCDAFRKELTDGRETSSVVAACLQLASRGMSKPIPMSRLTKFSGIEESKFRRSFLTICDELEVDFPLLKPVDYIPFLRSELEGVVTDRDPVETLLKAVEEKQAFVGKDPAGIAAGGVYVVHEQVTQAAVAETVGLSTETVRHRAKQLQEELDHA